MKLTGAIRYIFMLLGIFFSAQTNAYHIAGGDFTYRWLSGNTFEIKLTLYRDCSNPFASDFDSAIKVSIYNRSNDVLADSAIMNLATTDSLQLSGPGCQPPPTVCMQYGEYFSQVTLPSNPAGYYIIWERCCRNSTINNLINPDQSGMAFYAEMPDPSLHNSSPVFNSHPAPYICVNQFFRFAFQATDADGDSLVYELSDPLDGGHTSQGDPQPFSLPGTGGGSGPRNPNPAPYSSTSWASGFSISNICGSATPLTINSVTGEIEVVPDFQGIFAMALEVREYRNGVYIGLIRREIEFTVIVCTGNSSPNLPPGYTGIKNITVYATDSINLAITANDPEGDSVYINRMGNIFDDSNPIIIDTPYAHCDPVAGLDTATIYFTWNTGCQHASSVPYHIRLEAMDNGCPLRLTDIGLIDILVKPQPLIDKSNLLCIDLIDNNTLSITRLSDSNYVARFFKEFVVYRSVNGGPFNKYATINNTDPILIYDSAAIDNRSNDYCYSISAFNMCGEESEWSDTLCSISHINTHKNYIESVSVTAQDEITVKWESFNDGPYAKYSIYRADTSSVNNGSLVATLTSYPDFQWTDRNVDTDHQSYCYTMMNEDVCGNESDTSVKECSILLTGFSREYLHTLNWSEYINWKGGVGSYNVMRRPIEFNSFDLVSQESSSDFIYYDRSMERHNGVFRYYIKANEGSGGNQGESFSNEIELAQQPVLYSPSAFTPNNDGMNDFFMTASSFIVDYEIVIYNRWGQMVFTSNSMDDSWDGNLNGKNAPGGVYFYKIKYKGYEDKAFNERTGSLTLIR